MTTTIKFQHASTVLHLEEKNFTLMSRDVLEGLSAESQRVLGKFGDEGWELVSVLPYSRGGGGTTAVIAFFKRSV
jgi:hypothetical protein